MRAAVAIVADDLTGAADTGVGFHRSGLATIVTWANPDVDLGLVEGADAIAIDTGTRSATAPQAGEATARVVASMRQAGVATMYKKIDSMLRDHVGEEVRAALVSWHSGSIAIVAPAFPATGRTTIDDRQLLEGVPLERAAISALLEQAGVATGRASLSRVRAESLRDDFARCRDRGAGAVVCDAETDQDLQAIARAGAELGSPVVWVGAGGLAPAVATHLGCTRSPPRWRAKTTTGPVLIVVGSSAATARAQAADLAKAGAMHVSLPIGTRDGADDREDRALGRKIEELLRRQIDVVVTLGDTLQPRQPDDDRLTARLAALLRPLATLVGGLVVTGGQTAAAVLLAWGTTALRLVDEIEPGVPLSTSVAARPIPVVTKAGSFGSPTSLTRARAKLKTLADGEVASGSGV